MSAQFTARACCALCSAPAAQLTRVLSLAATPPANEFVDEAALGHAQEAIPLNLLLCGTCGHLQLGEIVDPRRLFQNYVYVSGTSPVFVAHFARYAADMCERFGLGANAFVVDVGSNDGTLLKQFQAKGIAHVLGIDPATEVVKEAQQAGVPSREAFFTPDLAVQLRAESGHADLICANNVFAHSSDLVSFGRSVELLLADGGVFAFEVSYLVDVIDKLLFDTIYHEHSSYHAATPLLRFFDSLGLRLFDAERIDTHGGSLRCYVCRKAAPHRDTKRLRGLVELEREMGLFSPEVYRRFKARISERGAEFRNRLREIQQSGQRVAGFGAPAKLTTLMHEFGLTGRDIDFIVDDSPWKQNLHTPGTHIRVVPSTELYERQPGWCVIFAWNFADPIIAKHKAYLQAGGHFLVPLPELREI